MQIRKVLENKDILISGIDSGDRIVLRDLARRVAELALRDLEQEKRSLCINTTALKKHAP